MILRGFRGLPRAHSLFWPAPALQRCATHRLVAAPSIGRATSAPTPKQPPTHAAALISLRSRRQSSLSSVAPSSRGQEAQRGSGCAREAVLASASRSSGSDKGPVIMGGDTPGQSKARRGVKHKGPSAAEDAPAGQATGQAAQEEVKPPPAKRARTSKKASEKAAEEAAAGSDGGEAVAAEDGTEAKAKPVKARKPRAKKAEPESAPPTATSAEPPAGGAQAKPPAKGKRAPQAPSLPHYTVAMRKPPPLEGSDVLKILSWNVAGLRALLKKQPDAISKLVEREGVEVVCLQEHKLQGEHTDDVEALMGLKGWSHHWACSTAKLGYSGVSVHTRTPPLSVTCGLGPAGVGSDPDPEHEGEGRVVTVELPYAYVVSVYVPNSSEGLKRLDYRVKRWDVAFAGYIKGLEARGKPVVVTGDLNCAHKEIDIHAPKTNLRSAGFTVEERESFGRLLLGEVGLVDTFRRLHPDTVAYTYFTRRFNCREQNKGWRLDYFLTSASLMPLPATTDAAAAPAEAPAAAPPATPWRVYDSWILQDVYGSDHLPLGLTLVKTATV